MRQDETENDPFENIADDETKAYENELQARRKAALKKKLINAGIWFAVGAVFLIIASTPEEMLESVLPDWGVGLVQLSGLLGICEIIGVCKFAKAVHDPLIPEDVELLKKKQQEFCEKQQREDAEAAAQYEAYRRQKQEEKQQKKLEKQEEKARKKLEKLQQNDQDD